MRSLSRKLKTKLKSKKVEDSKKEENQTRFFEKRHNVRFDEVDHKNITSFASEQKLKCDVADMPNENEKSDKLSSAMKTSDKTTFGRGTSFGSLSSLNLNGAKSEFKENLFQDKSNVSDDGSRKSSFSSLNSSLSSSMTSLSVKSEKQQSIFVPNSDIKRRSLCPVLESEEKSSFEIRKNLPFYRKVHPIKKQNSLKSFSAVGKETRQSRSKSVCGADLWEAKQMLDKLQEMNTALEIEVREKDEEVKMLSAAVSQVNQDWEYKVQGIATDVKTAHRQHAVLQAKLTKETTALKNISNKPAMKIPMQPPRRTLLSDSSEPTSDEVLSGSKSHATLSSAPSLPGKREHRILTKSASRQLIKTEEVRRNLFEALLTSKSLSRLSSDDLESIVDEMLCKRINKGERLMTEGMLGNRFYVLADGECYLSKQPKDEGASPKGRVIKNWEIFGESDVFYNTKRIWSCKCIRQGVVWYINKKEFKSTIMQQDIMRRKKEIFDVLREVKSFEAFDIHQIIEMAKISKVVHIAKGGHVIREKSRSNHVYVLKEGEVTETKIVDGIETEVLKFSPGELLNDPFTWEPHEESVVATGEEEIVQCVAIPKKYLSRLKGHMTSSMSDGCVTPTQIEANFASHLIDETDGLQSTSSGYTGNESVSSGYSSDSRNLIKERKKEKPKYDPTHINNYLQLANQLQGKTISDFSFITTIGHGAYGKVELFSFQNKDDQVFAVKKVSKKEVVAAENQQNIFNEKKLQIETSSQCPFIASMYSTLKDQKFVYFVMEYCPGGELFALLVQARHFSNDMARFYAGCVLEALTYLHSRHIVFRDLKPENVVFDRYGYCKLTDFGFAKKMTFNSALRTYTYCGTPEYMAPETILHQAQTFSVDLWSFGVFIFEILNGVTPFKNKNRDKLTTLILQGIEPRLEAVKVNKRIGPAANSLIRNLCHQRAEDRLGSGKNGIKDVSKHAWFYKLNWNSLRQRTLIPPWKPKLSNLQDASHFHFTSNRTDRKWDESDEFSGWDENF